MRHWFHRHREQSVKANIRSSRTCIFSLRIDPERLDFIARKARERGMTVSQAVREAAYQEARDYASNITLSAKEAPCPKS